MTEQEIIRKGAKLNVSFYSYIANSLNADANEFALGKKNFY